MEICLFRWFEKWEFSLPSEKTDRKRAAGLLHSAGLLEVQLPMLFTQKDEKTTEIRLALCVQESSLKEIIFDHLDANER